jgi:predicted enzyme related to lactoylglutathione lyase
MGLFRRIDVVSVNITKANWDKAKQFYSETLGLGAPTFAADEAGWVQFGFGGGEHEPQIALSLWNRPEPVPARDGGATLVFNVEDANAAVAELRKRGVKCEEPVAIPGMVTYATFYDLEGNKLQLAGPPPQA